MAAEILLQLLSTLSPSTAQIGNLFGTFAKLDPKMLEVVLQAMDPEMIRKMADWSDAFAKNINHIVSPPVQDAGGPGTSIDFDEVMVATKWHGDRLTPDLVDEASAQITIAIKANNWMQAINVGMAMAQILVVA